MELGYEIQLEQKQQLTQSQIQSLEILAMDSVELNQFLQNEYLENPLLDVSGTHSMGSGQEEINKTYEQTLTYGRNYEEMIEGLGTQGMVWNSMLEHQAGLTDEVEAKRQQISGVSTDEELVNLLQYQHAFNAASRYINAIDEMLQNLIERLA